MVMAGLDPAIHVLMLHGLYDVDALDNRGHYESHFECWY
jgi:hypothetical protein